jgi:signal transduction histidine kinase
LGDAVVNANALTRRLRAWGVRAHVVFLCAACILPLLAVSLLATWRLAEAEREADSIQLRGTAEALSGAIDLKLQNAATALSALATSPALSRATLAEFYRQCAAVAAEHNAWILLTDADGNELLNTQDSLDVPRRRLVRRDILERALQMRSFQVSDLLNMNPRNGPQVSTYLPVFRADGERFALMMSFRVEELARVLTQKNLPESWIVAVVDRNHVILARNRDMEHYVGVQVTPTTEALLKTTDAATFSSAAHDGMPVFGAFARSSFSGWTVFIGLPKAEVDAPLRQTFWRIGLAAAALLLLGGGLATLIGGHLARSLDRVSDAALALAEDLPWVPFRSTIREVNDAVAAHQAADNLLRQRSHERDQAEALLRDAVDSISEGFVIYDPDDRLVMCNQRYLDLYPRSAPAMVPGTRFEDILRYGLARGEYVDAVGREEQWLTERLRDHRAASEDVEQQHGDGRWIMVTERRTRNGGIAGLRIDITERKRAQADADAAQARVADFAEAATDWFWETDAECRLSFISDGFEKALGIPTAKILGRLVYLERDGVAEPHKADVLARRPLRDVLIERTDNGRTYFVTISGKPVYDDHGRFTGYRGTTRNVTAEISADRALAHQTEVFSTLIDNLPIGVGLVSPDLRWLAFNRTFLAIFDLAPGDIRVGDAFEQFLRFNATRGDYGPIGDIEAEVRRRMEVVRRGGAFQHARTRPDGRTIELRRVPLSGGGFVTTYIDVTAARRREDDLQDIRARLERQAEELDAARITAEHARESAAAANAAKSRFLANMSHELRTPLNAILGFSEIMAKRLLGPLHGPYHGYVQDIHVSGQYLLRLISDLLDLSKIEVGQMDLREEMVDLPDLANECMRLVLDKAQAGQVTMETKLPEKFPLVFADRLRLKQALLNLLSNAVKFTPPGGRIDMTARLLPDGGAVITVADTGIGMRAADIALALEPFRQIDNALTRRTEGTGLGLPLTKALIEMHGGSLQIRSEPGRGTQVDLRLPADRLVRAPGEDAAVRAEMS